MKLKWILLIACLFVVIFNLCFEISFETRWKMSLMAFLLVAFILGLLELAGLIRRKPQKKEGLK